MSTPTLRTQLAAVDDVDLFQLRSLALHGIEVSLGTNDHHLCHQFKVLLVAIDWEFASRPHLTKLRRAS